MFFLELLLQHMQILLCFYLFLGMIFVSRHHLIASISKYVSIMSGSDLNLQLCSTSMLSTTFPLHSSSAGVLPSTVVDGATHCYVVSIHLDILVHEQLDVFLDRQVHRHLTNCIPSCSLNNVFESALLEYVLLVRLRDS